jgi:hypothetical protein
MAISAGSLPPMGSPTGHKILSITSLEIPSSNNSRFKMARLAALPITPRKGRW